MNESTCWYRIYKKAQNIGQLKGTQKKLKKVIKKS